MSQDNMDSPCEISSHMMEHKEKIQFTIRLTSLSSERISGTSSPIQDHMEVSIQAQITKLQI